MDSTQGRILVVDDNTDILTTARLLLKKRFQCVDTLPDPQQLTALLAKTPYHIVLLDMNFSRDAASGEEGLYYLRQIQAQAPATQVVMMTAYGELELAVTAMKAGACDFVTKPWDNRKLIAALEHALTNTTAPALATEADEQVFIGDSPAMAAVLKTMEMVAPTDANVLITGESGTGKELVARALHQASPRQPHPFINVDMGALSEQLIESELFGHRKGAFTDAKADKPGRFQQAEGGTLFLDELGNLPLTQQTKLLAALQNREVQPLGASKPQKVDIRLICATNEDLEQRITSGQFRQDLLYRINTVTLHLPPLRERTEDILPLARHFLRQYQQHYRRPLQPLTAPIAARLTAYHWPGNVRELQHAMEKLVILSGEGPLNEALLALAPAAEAFASDQNVNLEQLEQRTIEQALTTHKGNISRAAKALGLTRAALYRRLEKYGF